ncbi:MAG: hypothetical protein ACKV2V_20460, partial [Blastocatellia bacterium]
MKATKTYITRIVAFPLALLLLTAGGFAQTKKKAPAQTPVEKMAGHSSQPPDRQLRFTLPAGVSLEDGLTDEEAIAIALWNNAQLHADLAALGLARADLLDAGLLRNPLLQIVLPLG